MSHAPRLGLASGSPPLAPLTGRNVAALQHEGRVGFGPGRGVAGHRAPPGPGGCGVDGRGGGVEGLGGRRGARHGPCCAEAAPERALGPRPGARRGGRELRGRGRRSGPDSQAPGGRPHDRGGDPARQDCEERARGDPRKAAAAGTLPSLGKLVPGRPGSRLPLPLLLSAPRPLALRVAPARVASQGRQPQLPADERGEGGRPEVGRQAWRPWAGLAAAASARGRPDKLRLCPTRQETFRPCQRRPP